MSENVRIDRRSFCLTAAAGAAAIGAAGLPGFPAQALADEAVADGGEKPVTDLYVVDRYVTKPGDGEAMYQRYLEYYAPLAEAAGAELVSARVAPPVWLPMDSNVLTFTWKVADILGGWGMAWPRLMVEDYPAWGEELFERTVQHDRSYFVDPADMETICDV